MCLERMFGARQLVCCASAMTDFRTILGTLGGPGERERGEELIARIQVVPDQTSVKTERLATSGKVTRLYYVCRGQWSNYILPNKTVLDMPCSCKITFCILTGVSVFVSPCNG